MWKLRLVLILALVITLLIPVAVMAFDITITMTPEFTQGINEFKIVYVTDQRMDLSWFFDAGVISKIMIRAKYSAYPADIPNESTAPTDGYLVYYGTGMAVSDTSMDFDQNSGTLYYKAWGQKLDGTWFTNTSTGAKESQEMELLFFLALAAIITFFGLRTSYWVMKVIAGFTWFGVLAYWKNATPTNITPGSPTDTMIILLFVIIGIAMLVMPLWTTKNENGSETGTGFRLPFQKTDEEEAKARYKPSKDERQAAYMARVNGAVRGRRR